MRSIERVRTLSWASALALIVLAGQMGCGDGGASKPGASSSSSTSSSGSGGAGSGSNSAVKVMFVSNSESDWWAALEKGMRDGGAEFGVEVELRRNNSGSADGQIKLLEDALSRSDIQGVAVSVYEAGAPGIADAMRKLRDAGKKVITVDSDIDSRWEDVRLAYIGTDNRVAGEIAGKAAAAVRPAGGKTAVFVGTAAAANAIERREGFFVGAGGKFQQLEVFEDGTDQTVARNKVNDAISKNKPDVLLGLWSYNAPAIAEEALKAPADYRKATTIVTFDLDKAAIAHLERKEIDVTVCQNPWQMGYEGVQLLKAFVQNDPATIDKLLGGKKIRNTEIRVIVPDESSPVKGDNVMPVAKMKEWLKSKNTESS